MMRSIPIRTRVAHGRRRISRGWRSARATRSGSGAEHPRPVRRRARRRPPTGGRDRPRRGTPIRSARWPSGAERFGPSTEPKVVAQTTIASDRPRRSSGEIGGGVARLQGGGRSRAGHEETEQRQGEEIEERPADDGQRAEQPHGIGEDQARASPVTVHHPRDRDRDDRRADHRGRGRQSAVGIGGQIGRQQRPHRRAGRHPNPAENLRRSQDHQHPSLHGGMPRSRRVRAMRRSGHHKAVVAGPGLKAVGSVSIGGVDCGCAASHAEV